MQMKRCKLCFMTYESRSGSTYLSGELDKYEDIGVMVEADLVRTVLYYEKEIRAAGSIQKIVNILSENSRFNNLRLSESDISRFVAVEEKNEISGLIQGIVSAYFEKNKPTAKICIIKEGANGFRIAKLAKLFPSANFLHIIRDGRAVYNSKKNTEKPYSPGKYMARDPITAAKTWVRMIKTVDEFTSLNPERVKIIYYEKLINDKESQILSIRRYFQLNDDVKHTKRAYANVIPEKEKGIHELVGKAAVVDRLYAWKKELDEIDIMLFQHYAKASLLKHGYALEKYRKIYSLAGMMCFLKAMSYSYYLIYSDRIKTLVRPSLVIKRINEKIKLS